MTDFVFVGLIMWVIVGIMHEFDFGMLGYAWRAWRQWRKDR